VNSNSASIRKAPAYNVNFFIQKPVSRNLVLKIDAGFTYLSWKFNVGTRVDSIIFINSPGGGGGGSGSPLPVGTVNGYYRVSTSTNNRYTSKYQLFGLSSSLLWKIAGGRKINLYWESGLSYKRLLGSNMLHYSSSLPGYYKDNSLLAKNQLFFIAGLSFNAGKQFYVGPAVNYGLTTVLKNNTGVKKHFSSIELNTRFLFHK
jgi:hypothetical protein